MGEERVGTLLREATGVSGREGGFGERIWAGIKEDFKPENLGSEFVTLLVPAGVKFGMSKGLSLTKGQEVQTEAQQLDLVTGKGKIIFESAEDAKDFAKRAEEVAMSEKRDVTITTDLMDNSVTIDKAVEADQFAATGERLGPGGTTEVLEDAVTEDTLDEAVRSFADKKQSLVERGQALTEEAETADDKRTEEIGQELDELDAEIETLDINEEKLIGNDPKLIAKRVGITLENPKDRAQSIYQLLGVDEAYKKGVARAELPEGATDLEREAFAAGQIQAEFAEVGEEAEHPDAVAVMAEAESQTQETVTEKAEGVQELVDLIKDGDINDELIFEFLDTVRSLQDAIDSGEMTEEEAYTAIKNAGYEGMDPADAFAFGSNQQKFIDGIKKGIIQLSKGADISTVLEEKAEDWYKRKADDDSGFEDRVAGWRADYEKKTGDTSGQSDLEWFSSRAIEYAVFGKEQGIGRPLRNLLDKFKEWAKQLVEGATKLKKFLKTTRTAEGFEAALAESIRIAEIKNQPTEGLKAHETKKVKDTTVSTGSAKTKHTTLNDESQPPTFSIHPAGIDFKDTSREFKRFYSNLSPQAKKSFDHFQSLQDIEFEASKKPVWILNTKSKETAKRDGEKWAKWAKKNKGAVLNRFLTTEKYNEFIAKNPHAQQAMQDVYKQLEPAVRKAVGLKGDGTIKKGMLDTIGFAVKRSMMQRIVDARNVALQVPVTTSEYTLPGTNQTVDLGVKGMVPVDEEYRMALVAEMRRKHADGTLSTSSPGAMSTDTWGTMGFIAPNQKTIASTDTTTICPQIFYNKGCWYCYRRSALETDINNKLGGEKVWYSGEILRLRDSDRDGMNKIGGLRHQSFGDWFGNDTQTLRMYVDMLYDAETIELQSKIITKDPKMVDFTEGIFNQGIKHKTDSGQKVSIGEYAFFNLSTDYLFEPAGKLGQKGVAPIDPSRPFKKVGDRFFWKRAMSVEEADSYAERLPWVNIRTVATDAVEFIVGLIDPRVHVVTGYHGHKREYERLVQINDGERMTMGVEPIGDAGMPRFNPDGSIKWQSEPYQVEVKDKKTSEKKTVTKVDKYAQSKDQKNSHS